MKTIQHVLMIAAMGMLAGCGANAGDEGTNAPQAKDVTTSVESITLLDCQKAAATCVQSAKSFTDVLTCTTKLQSCAVQSAKDAAAQGAPLKACRTKANACLKGALTVSDISACRAVLATCTKDAASTVDTVLETAVDEAQETISEATQAALGVLDGVSDVTGTALDSVAKCETSANACIKGALTVSDISPCQGTFETCLGGAVATIDSATQALPVPGLGEIAADFGACQTRSITCLADVLTLTGGDACKGTLQTCVKNATTVVDTTVDDINNVLPPGIQIPQPGAAVDCTTDAVQCLLQPFANPFDCAAKADSCLTK